MYMFWIKLPVSYQLLHSKLPQSSTLKQHQHLLSHTLFWGQEFGRGLRSYSEFVVIGRFDWSWRIQFQDCSLTWLADWCQLLAEALVPCHMICLHRAAWVSSWYCTWLSRGRDLRKKLHCLLWPSLWRHCHFSSIILIM